MITSTSNENIKTIRKLRQRKFRDESGQYYIEGMRIIGQALKKEQRFTNLIYSPDLLTKDFGQEILNQAQRDRIPLLEVSKEVFQAISLKDNPQGIGATLIQQLTAIDALSVAANDTWVALDEVQDPGNLGTILRTSDAVGAKGVILLDNSTDPFDPTAIRASMGAIYSQQIVRASLESFAGWRERVSIKVIGTADAADHDYHHFAFPSPVVVLMGSEREGLDERHYQICDAVVKIPMTGESDSLNLAIATAVVLYEIYNQKRDRVNQ